MRLSDLSRYGSSVSIHHPIKNSLLNHSHHFGYSANRIDSPTKFSAPQPQNINVSLYKYLDLTRDSDPTNPLNFDSRIEGVGSKQRRQVPVSSMRSYSMANISLEENRPKNQGSLARISTLDYMMDSRGAANRSVNPPQDFIFVRSHDGLMAHSELGKAGFDMSAIDKEHQINKDLSKIASGQLEVCKGILDSIRAVRIGDCRFAQNILNSNKIILGASSAKKGKEFLLRDHEIDLDSAELSTERFRLVSTERKQSRATESQNEHERV